MFAYELHQERHNELRHRADHWRLLREAKAARTAQRRARRGTSGGTARSDTEGAPAPNGSRGSLGAVRRALHARSAA